MNDNFLPTANLALEQNTLLINTGDRVVLFDTGTGTAKAFGDKSGRFLSNLKAASIEPKDVDAVVLTHAHPDHCWGLMSDGNERIFPNAQIYMSQADFDFWTDEAKGTDDMMKMMVSGIRRHLLPNRDRMVWIRDGQEFLPGIQAIAAPGHTVGHTIFMISSGSESLCNVGDIAHHHILSLERPRSAFAFDTDGKQGVESRLRVFDMLSSRKMQAVAYHFPFPGVGFVGKQGDAFRYFPSSVQTAP